MIGVVLAGGASRRMGQDKALLPFPNPWPMAMTVAAALAPHVTRVLLVRRSPGPERWWHPSGLEVEVVYDAPSSVSHPLTGVLTAWEHAPEELLVCPCDVPFVDVSALVAATGAGVAVSAGRVHPLVARLPLSLRGLVERLVAEGEPARRLAEVAEGVELDPATLRNVNAPQDVRS